MKIKDICSALNITRPGLYWMLENNDLQGHATRKPSGRWYIDDEGFELLKKIRKQSKHVLVEVTPTDPHTTEKIRGMQLEIDRLTEQLKLLSLKCAQGVYLRNSVEEVVSECKELDVQTKRQFLRLTAAFDNETSIKSLKKQLKSAKKQDENVLEMFGQNKLF